MSIVTSKLLRAVVPKFIHKVLLKRAVRSSIFTYYSNLPTSPDGEIETVLDYLRKKAVTNFPYFALDKYIPSDIKVFRDKEKGLKYVLLDGKRLYFKKKWNKLRIKKAFNGLLKEQDPVCPHCYENGEFKIVQGDVLVDVGAAEGNFALSVIEKVSKVILFESDERWVEALNATFEPWKEKVTIVRKFVGDITNDGFTTLDDYFTENEKISFLKIDVEGAEKQLINGAKRILQNTNPLKLAICTYHKQEDEKLFTEILRNHGFETSHSDGYILMYHDRKLQPPYFRRGLIRAVKH
ncbi:MAG: FkbM family methyltransferase [Mariniphaga sp.]